MYLLEVDGACKAYPMFLLVEHSIHPSAVLSYKIVLENESEKQSYLPTKEEEIQWQKNLC